MSLHGQEDGASSGGGTAILPTTPKLRDDVKKVLPNLPGSDLNEFVKELENNYKVFSLEDELPFVDKKELEQIKTLKGAQKAMFLKHAEQLRNPGAKKASPTKIVKATGIKGTAGNARKIHLKDNSRVSAVATGGGAGSSSKSGNEEISATGIEGGDDVVLEGNSKVSANARGRDVDYSNADFIDRIKKKLELPDDKIQKLVEELADDFGVYGLTDFKYANLDDMRKLDTLVGAKLKLFIDWVKEVKDWYQNQNAKDEPPFGLYN